MQVLHAWWRTTGTLVLWVEDGDAALPPAGRGRRPAVAPHPFATAPALPDTAGLRHRASTATVALPTRGRLPDPSPASTRTLPDAESRKPLTLARWELPVVEIDSAATALVLLLADPADTAAGSRTDEATVDGPGLRHLREIARFADDLASRGRVVPGLSPAEAATRWQPVVTGPDAEHARALALALPPAALGDGDNAASAVLASAVSRLVDAAVRRRLARARRGAGAISRPSQAWAAALLNDSGGFTPGGPAQLLRLRRDAASWHRAGFAGAARVRFRLNDPEPLADGDDSGLDEGVASGIGDDTWTLDFALQAVERPSVVVDADAVWDGDPAARHLGVSSPQRSLLSELGRATRLYPGLEPALRTARPTTLTLDSAGAYTFLTQAAPALAAAGFGIQLPAWWANSKRARIGARLTAGTPAQPGAVAGSAGLGRQALLDYEWQVAIGDTVLTAQELADLAALQQPLVRLRGQWVELDPERLRSLAASGRWALSGRMTLGDLLTTVADGESPDGLPLVDVDVRGWLGDLLGGATAERLEVVATPDGFVGTLRPYQQRGLAWLSFLDRVGLGGVLADDMGLGKTVQLLALLAGDPPSKERDDDAGPTLLICPMSLVGNWQREAAKFAPDLAVHVHHGAERARGAAFAAAVAGADLVLTTYAIATRDVAALSQISWRRVVLDEAQAVKNAATKQSVAVRALPSQHRIAMTGTPVENRLADLWSIMDFANPGLLGNAASFARRFAVPVERHGDEDAAARLQTLTRPFVLRRVKTDRTIISDLPDKLEMEVVCSLTAEQAALYRAVVDDMMAKVEASEGIERRGLVLATMTRLKQVCNHPAQLLRDGSRIAGRSGKLLRVEETLEEVLASGERALLFTQFAEFGSMLRAHLSARFGREVLYLHGGVPKAERDAMVARFQSTSEGGGEQDGAAPLFVLSLKAGGTGLTLTAANHVIHVDRWWNPAVEDQATDRAFRIGQTRAVQVRKLVCAGTLEEKIAAMIRDKRGLAAKIVGTGEGWLTELSTDALRELITLEPGAVVE